MEKQFYSKTFNLGILGGGQLGRMFIQEAVNYDVRVNILDPSTEAPCAKIAHEFTQGDLNDFDTVYNFGKDKDVVTIEIENVNVDALEKLEKEGVKVFPQPNVLRIVQDKGLQKQFYADNNIPTAPFYIVENKEEILKYRDEFPFMQKLRKGGYDGKGVTPLRNDDEYSKAFEAPSVLEKFVDMDREISVIVARNEGGEVSSFPLVECEFNPEANLVEFLFAPSSVSKEVEGEATKIAEDLVNKLGFVGILAIEMFVSKDGDVWVNEVAPRPHNSGHHTIEANITSQYEQHLRAVLNLPLGSTQMIMPAVMVNVLGEKGYQGPVFYEAMNEVLKIGGTKVHIYGKTDTKDFRKMGHVTVIDNDLDTAKKKAKEVQKTLKVISK